MDLDELNVHRANLAQLHHNRSLESTVDVADDLSDLYMICRRSDRRVPHFGGIRLFSCLPSYPQVRRSLGEIVTRYRGARKTIRDAASAAGSMGDRVVHGDDLKVQRYLFYEHPVSVCAHVLYPCPHPMSAHLSRM